MLFIGLANLLFIDRNLGGLLHMVEGDRAARCDLRTTPLPDQRSFTAPTPSLGVKHMPPVTRTQGITDNVVNVLSKAFLLTDSTRRPAGFNKYY